MNTKAKSVQVFEVRLWSPSYYGEKTSNKHHLKIYRGFIVDSKTKERVFFNSPAKFMTAVEELFLKEEQKKKRKVIKDG